MEEAITVLTEQAQEIGKLEVTTEKQKEIIEKVEQKVESAEQNLRWHDEKFRRLTERIEALEGVINEWTNKTMKQEEPEEPTAEGVLQIPLPLPEAEETVKEAVKEKKNLWNWLF